MQSPMKRDLIICNSSDVELINPSLKPSSRGATLTRGPSIGVVHSLGAVGLQQDDEHSITDEHQDLKSQEKAAKWTHWSQNHQKQRDDR